jgi:hypothetical protein
MTTATDTSTDEQARVLSARTRQTYTADWALFTDQCAATDPLRYRRTRGMSWSS